MKILAAIDILDGNAAVTAVAAICKNKQNYY